MTTSRPPRTSRAMLRAVVLAFFATQLLLSIAGNDGCPTHSRHRHTRRTCGQVANSAYMERAFPRERAARPYPPPTGCPTEGPCDDPRVRGGTRVGFLTAKLRVHVMCSDRGELPDGVGRHVVDEQIASLSRDLGPYAIGVHLTSISFHRNGRYFNVSSDDPKFFDIVLQMKKEYATEPESSINVYVMQSPGSLMGFGTFPWESETAGYGGGLWLNSRYTGWGNRTATHELGHNFGLLHTFEGSDPCNGSCVEYVHRYLDPSAETVGDYCSDTPADEERFDCGQPPSNATDCRGTPYGQTDYTNYMSYGPDDCINHFTDQQVLRMHCWICNSPVAKQVKGCHGR